MSNIRESLVALDTNQYLFAVRRDAGYPFCETLIFDRVHLLRVFVPGEIHAEMTRNLSDFEVRAIHEVLRRARSVAFDYEPVEAEAILAWEERGAKKGDAVIAATLERADVRYFVSENRHFMREIADLPFMVVGSATAVRLIDATS